MFRRTYVHKNHAVPRQCMNQIREIHATIVALALAYKMGGRICPTLQFHSSIHKMCCWRRWAFDKPSIELSTYNTFRRVRNVYTKWVGDCLAVPSTHALSWRCGHGINMVSRIFDLTTECVLSVNQLQRMKPDEEVSQLNMLWRVSTPQR